MDPAEHAATLVRWSRSAVDGAVEALRGRSGESPADVEHQVVGYEIATAAGRVRSAEALLTRAGDSATAELALLHAGGVASELHGRLAGRATLWGDPTPLAAYPGAAAAIDHARDPALVEAAGAQLASTGVPRHLDEDLELARSTFREYTAARIVPAAEDIHRRDADVPEWLIADLAAMGCFGLSIPDTYGGAWPEAGDRGEALRSMLVVTEELSYGSLGAAGSLVTRPEMLASALLDGGSDAQRDRWLPAIAAGETMCAIAVTEPDHGSDVAGLRLRARRDGDDYLLTGTKTWCTFAGRAELVMLLARTGAPEDGHHGLSAFVLEKPPYAGREWVHAQPGGGRVEARAIPTIGYRGMHSFELSFDDYRVPAANLIGEAAGEGRGFYLQMGAFATGRLQTAARAVGVMQAAFDAAAAYASERTVFGQRLAAYPLSRAKIAWMAAEIAAARELAHTAAARQGEDGAGTDAALAKSMACAAAERVTREAQQLHGGMGYAEEYAVSRYFVDARVLSIFEGADEVLALKVILRSLLAG